MGETDLQHKVLAVAEEEGAERAAYALKLLQSEGELRIASTGKDGTDRPACDSHLHGARAGRDLLDDDDDRRR